MVCDAAFRECRLTWDSVILRCVANTCWLKRYRWINWYANFLSNYLMILQSQQESFSVPWSEPQRGCIGYNLNQHTIRRKTPFKQTKSRIPKERVRALLCQFLQYVKNQLKHLNHTLVGQYAQVHFSLFYSISYWMSYWTCVLVSKAHPFSSPLVSQSLFIYLVILTLCYLK